MNNFVFYNPTKIIFGKETIRAVGKEIPQGSKVMITFGGGSIKRNKIYDEVLAALAGFEVTEFGGIEPNPTYETLMQCVERVLRENIDYLLAVGGGSVIDGTKFIAAAALYQGEPWEIVKKYGMTVERALPFGTVLNREATDGPPAL